MPSESSQVPDDMLTPTPTFDARLHFAKSRKRLALPYQVVEFPGQFARTSSGTQRRLRDRLLVEPMIELSGYTCKAVIDWLEIGFTIRAPAPTQSIAINRWLEQAIGRSLWVGGPAREESFTGRDFVVRVQDPDKATVAAVLAEIETRRGLEGKPELRGIEVSVDFYPKSGSEDDRQRMVGALQKHFLPHWTIVQEIVREEETGKAHSAPRSTAGLAPHQTQTVVWRNDDVAPYIDATYYIGPKHGEKLWRVQDKISDHRNGQDATGLPWQECRARVEVCLRDGALPVKHLDDLDRLRFEHLTAEAFPFKLATVPKAEGMGSSAMQWFLSHRFKRAGVYGIYYQEDRWGRNGVRSRYGTLVTWPALQKKVRGALERLRWR